MNHHLYYSVHIFNTCVSIDFCFQKRSIKIFFDEELLSAFYQV